MSCVGCMYTIKSQQVKGKDGEMVAVGDVACPQTYECNTSADRPTPDEARQRREEKRQKESRSKK